MPDVRVQSTAGLEDGPTSPGSGSVVTVAKKPRDCARASSVGGWGGGSRLETDPMVLASPGGSRAVETN